MLAILFKISDLVQVRVLICFKLLFSIQENGWKTPLTGAWKTLNNLCVSYILVESLCGQGALLQSVFHKTVSALK